MIWHDIHAKHAMDGTILDIGGLPKKVMKIHKL
jgi:hypothetical protein